MSIRGRLAMLSVMWAIGVPILTLAEPPMKVKDAWALESPPTVTTGVAYMTLTNEGGEMDRLSGVSSSVCKVSELHEHLRENNVMKMRRVEAIELKPGETTVLQPGGLHVMLIGLKQPLVEGEHFPMTLHFEKTEDVTVDVLVRKLGGG